MQTSTDLLHQLVNLARTQSPENTSDPIVLSYRSDRLVIRVGPVVVKAHSRDTQVSELAQRMHMHRMSLHNIFLNPLRTDVFPLTDGRVATLWPAADRAVDDTDTAPWQEAAGLLARLHQAPAQGLSPCRAPRRVMQALQLLKETNIDPWDASLKAIRAAAQTLHVYENAAATNLVHGDWHLGQVVACPDTGWRLIDIDDLGRGNPAWDLARVGAYFAAGMINPHHFQIFLSAYQAAGGPAIPAKGDPWETLDRPARALLVQCAANALVRSHASRFALEADDEAQLLIEACRRIALLPSRRKTASSKWVL